MPPMTSEASGLAPLWTPRMFYEIEQWVGCLPYTKSTQVSFLIPYSPWNITISDPWAESQELALSLVVATLTLHLYERNQINQEWISKISPTEETLEDDIFYPSLFRKVSLRIQHLNSQGKSLGLISPVSTNIPENRCSDLIGSVRSLPSKTENVY